MFAALIRGRSRNLNKKRKEDPDFLDAYRVASTHGTHREITDPPLDWTHWLRNLPGPEQFPTAETAQGRLRSGTSLEHSTLFEPTAVAIVEITAGPGEIPIRWHDIAPVHRGTADPLQQAGRSVVE